MSQHTQADPLRVRCRRALQDHRRRARAEGQAPDYGLPQLEVLARAAVQCHYCRMPVGWDFQFEHYRPTCRGGAHALANLVVVHPECNAAKGQMDGDEYRRLLELLKSFHPAAAADVMRRLRAGGRIYRGAR